MTTLEMRMNLLNQISGTNNLSVLKSILQQALMEVNHLLTDDYDMQSQADKKLQHLKQQMSEGNYNIPQELQEISKGVTLPNDLDYKKAVSDYLATKYA